MIIFERLIRSLPGRYNIRKMRFDLEPHIGAGDLKLGMTREETRAILGKPAYSSEKSVMDYGDFSIPIPAKDGYFKNELQITFDDNGKVDFIEFSGKDSEFVEVYLKDIEVFKTPAQQLLQKISDTTRSEFDKEHDEIPYSYVFPSIDLAVWRQVIPGQDEQTGEILEPDEGKYFWTIGIGIKGYYKKE